MQGCLVCFIFVVYNLNNKTSVNKVFRSVFGTFKDFIDGSVDKTVHFIVKRHNYFYFHFVTAFLILGIKKSTQPDKAKAFKEALGYTKENYQDLIDNIQNNFKEDFMVLKNEDKFGKRYEYVMELTGANGRKANVCTGWIKENDSSEPRMTSAYVTKKKVTPNESWIVW